MNRKTEIESRAIELAQRYFPDSQSIWARPNWEAQAVEAACVEIANWADKTMIEKACLWLRKFMKGPMGDGLAESIVDDFRKAMEE